VLTQLLKSNKVNISFVIKNYLFPNLDPVPGFQFISTGRGGVGLPELPEFVGESVGYIFINKNS
jgi:hypothetical protein